MKVKRTETMIAVSSDSRKVMKNTYIAMSASERATDGNANIPGMEKTLGILSRRR